MGCWAGTANLTEKATIKLAAAAATDTEQIVGHTGGAANLEVSPSRFQRFAGRVASDVLKMQYLIAGGAGTASFRNRFMVVTPVRVRHDG
jgi:hypothetical protein